MAQSKTSQKAIDTAERRRKAVEYRKAGLNFQTIADQLGYKSASGAYRAVRAALLAAVREPTEELIALEVARLDDLLRGIWADARTGDLDKLDRVLRIMQRRAKLLGLDAPVNVHHTLDVEAERISRETGASKDEVLRYMDDYRARTGA